MACCIRRPGKPHASPPRLNSIVISMVIVTLRLIFCSAAGYAFARIVLPLATPFLLGYGVLQ